MVTEAQWLFTAFVIGVVTIVTVLVMMHDTGWYRCAREARAYYDPVCAQLEAARQQLAAQSAALTTQLEQLCVGWDEMKHLVQSLIAAAETDMRRLELPHSRLPDSPLHPDATQTVDDYIDALVREIEARYHPKEAPRAESP